MLQEGEGGVKVSKALGEEVGGGGDRAAEVFERGHFLLEVKLERVAAGGEGGDEAGEGVRRVRRGEGGEGRRGRGGVKK